MRSHNKNAKMTYFLHVSRTLVEQVSSRSVPLFIVKTCEGNKSLATLTEVHCLGAAPKYRPIKDTIVYWVENIDG
ncbi:hypothetical protein XELAEV_18018946mg [Xenopus laevis]|uniref:Uncharacterized protein n=1 Tax=Xenopus laevis TaxID=8355 RepID=A0A974DG96_XENLA|nr:hypothetical protein XELAEV_18018946mg [Xenopus laevis]